MFALAVRFFLRDQKAAEGFDRLVAETAPLIRSEEPGTLVYLVHGVTEAPLSRVFYELYADQAAFEAHEGQPHVQRFLEEREQYLTDVRVEFLGPPTGKGA